MPGDGPAPELGAGRGLGACLGYALAVTGVYLLSFAVRFDGAVPHAYVRQAAATLPAVVGVKLAVFLALGIHRRLRLSASFSDLILLTEAACISSVAVLAFSLLGVAGFEIALPRSIFLIDWAATLLMLLGVHSSGRLLREQLQPLLSGRPAGRALVLSASEAGGALVREIQRRPALGLKVVGVLDPDPRMHGRTVHGAKVLGSPDQIGALAARHRVAKVVIPTPAVSPREIRGLVSACGPLGVRVQVVPGFDALLSGVLTVEPRDVDIQDLLCREPVQLVGESVERFLKGRVVLVTGAVGSIGSEICRQVLAFGPSRLVLLDHSENGLFFLERQLLATGTAVELVPQLASITDGPRIRACLEQHRPDVVFHAAAHKHVPLMEQNPGEAIKNNTLGTRTLVEEVVRAGAEAFVMISTDKAVKPTSVMGASKRLAEMYVQSLQGSTRCRLITVRFGNVLGSNGSVVPIFREQIRGGGPVTVTHPEMTRFFMTIPEAAQLVLQSGALGRGGEIFVLDMGKPVRVLDLAREMIRLAGLREGRDIEIAITGLRPGEKLHEELYDRGEERLPTPHPKITVARAIYCQPDQVRAKIETLARAVRGPASEVIEAIKEALPEYRPNRDGLIAKPDPVAALAVVAQSSDSWARRGDERVQTAPQVAYTVP